MKNIKYFKYKSTYSFEKFLNNYGYKLADVKGYKFGWKNQYHGNVLKTYVIYLKDDECVYFKVVYFKNLNECHQSSLGFNGSKLLDWYQNANVRCYRVYDVWFKKYDRYVITD